MGFVFKNSDVPSRTSCFEGEFWSKNNLLLNFENKDFLRVVLPKQWSCFQTFIHIVYFSLLRSWTNQRFTACDNTVRSFVLCRLTPSCYQSYVIDAEMILNQVRKKAALLVSGWSASYYPGIRNCEWMPEPDFRALPLPPGHRTLDSSLDCLKSFDNLATYSRPTEEEI